ncbi:MAG: PRC-barrel domain-containing protein [Xanthobacteraceae bacterium]|nr:PRC-barrel domain-containing protein [Xanthobacteraceae bacterium]MBV9237578.1 PRC-barrel domain-containing protein [Xanthobacteraceae bacterium]MBV9627490.1 PRC-barrel domain-containing protein [Xanthobacteraceae bacterium]
MTRMVVALAAASTFTLSVALAQSPASSVGDADNPTAHAAKVIDQQKPDEWLASKFKGTDVLGADGTKVGSVDDILFDRAGQIKAIVVGVGGFLGIGSKDVALEFNNFQVVPGKDGNADQLKLAMSKEDLSAANEFQRYQPPRPARSTPGPGTADMGRRQMAPQQQ